MKPHQKIHQAKLNEWATLIADQKASGLTVREWCLENNLTIHKYNYWKHLLKETLSEQLLPDIVQIELPIASSPISSFAPSISDNTNCTNRANRSICTTDIPLAQISHNEDNTNCANRTKVNFSLNGLPIEVDSDVPSDFLKSLIKAVRDV